VEVDGMLIKKDIAQELTCSDECEGYKVVERRICDTTRWSIISMLVIEKDGKYYASSYSNGATEQQDESPFEYDKDEIEFKEVHKVVKIISVFE
jgi:hypothetical protein